MSTATSLVRVVLTTAARRGVDPGALLAEVKLDPGVVADKHARVPTRLYLECFERGVARSNDLGFGSEAARYLDAEAFGLLGFVLASSSTLRDAIGRFCRYARLICDELSIALVERGDAAAIVYVLDETPHVPALFEMAFTHLVHTAKLGTRGAFQATHIVLRHRVAHPALSRVLGAEVALGGVEDAVYCDRRALDMRLRGDNPALLDILEAHADHVLAERPKEQDLLANVRVAVRVLLPLGEPSLATVAARLGLGERTLQRRLRSAGVTFRALVDDVRREHAVAQLAMPGVSVAEVAFSLGFSGTSAFHHAFRRWTGLSPSAAKGA